MFTIFWQVMSYSAFIFAQANVPIDFIPYVIVGTGTINVLCTVIAVCCMSWTTCVLYVL